MSIRTEYDNECHTRDNCPGAGYPEHIQHSLAETPLLKLMAGIIGHCGDNISCFRSCTCCKNAIEIGRRGTPDGQYEHRKAVEAKHLYLEKKFKENE